MACWYTIGMNALPEIYRDNFCISTEPAWQDVSAIHAMLSRSYWAKGRTPEMVARVVSDYTTFAWLCDVFIHEDYRGWVLGKWLIQTVSEHPDLQGLRRFFLMTSDAHGLYS